MAFSHSVPIFNPFTYITHILVSVKYSSVYLGTAHRATLLGQLEKKNHGTNVNLVGSLEREVKLIVRQAKVKSGRGLLQ